jgi:DNA invertase Pin-like site-specific DNA recombinase
MTVQRQAQADRDACDRLLKAIFDRGLGQRQIARVTGIPLSTVQRALQRVIYPYRQDRPIEDAPTWKKRRAQLESLAIDQLQRTRDPTAPKSRIAPRKARSRTLRW